MQKNRLLFVLIVIVAVLPVLVFSLLKKDEPRNGDAPCMYDVKVMPALITAVRPRDSLYSEVVFLVNEKGKEDTLYYSTEFGKFASGEDIARYDLRPGNSLRFEHHVALTGNCDPEFYILKLESYKPR
ncbi:MAG: hypothetical protein AB1458_06880 [Bacteroidota bacterium]